MPKVVEQVTYLPGSQDPSFTKWGGHTFQANVSKEIKGDPDGTASEKLNHHIIEAARNNPHFQVGNTRPRRERTSMPKDSREYRAYLANWLKEEHFEEPEELIARFARDRDLQAKCDVGADDFGFIGELFMPRLHELARAHDMTEAQVAGLWLNHGYNQLPW